MPGKNAQVERDLAAHKHSKGESDWTTRRCCELFEKGDAIEQIAARLSLRTHHVRFRLRSQGITPPTAAEERKEKREKDEPKTRGWRDFPLNLRGQA